MASCELPTPTSRTDHSHATPRAQVTKIAGDLLKREEALLEQSRVVLTAMLGLPEPPQDSGEAWAHVSHAAGALLQSAGSHRSRV